MRKILCVLALACSGWVWAEGAHQAFPIADTGLPFTFSYEKYGTISGKGTNDFKYKITDRPGLAETVGAGIYPNFNSLLKDPSYLAWKAKNPGSFNHWDQIQSGDSQKDFYVWATAKDVSPGVRLLFTAKALVEAGHIEHALKAYHAILMHFPKEICWSGDHTFFWYVGAEAVNQIEFLTHHHVDIGYRLKDVRFQVVNGNDTDQKNDVFVIYPGTWEKYTPRTVNLNDLKVARQRGRGIVHLIQYTNGHWQLVVNGKPLVVRGLSYNPTPIGQHISSYGQQWMWDDRDENGQADAPFDTWVDRNGDNRQDRDEPAAGDFELMRRMGVNTIRIYRSGEGTDYNPNAMNKDLLRTLHKKYGISVIMGDFLGAYTVGSGALWEDGTDYTDPIQLERMRQIIRSYVMDHRAEPYVLLWLLGNENMMPPDYTGVNATRTRAAGQVKAYLRFVNEIADMIHQLDGDHPVAVGNLGTLNAEEYGKYAPAVDIFGANLYRGSTGFGSTWKDLQKKFDRPVLITEYGCDAWDSRKNNENEKAQAEYHAGNWKDIELHFAGGPAEGNAIGGVIFEFTDEWWKSNQGGWDTHDSEKDSAMAFPDGWSSEEWYGVMALGDGSKNPFMRRPRQIYDLYKDKLWKD